jgi:hypothetical protein
MLRVYIDSDKVTGDMPRDASITGCGVAVEKCRVAWISVAARTRYDA